MSLDTTEEIAKADETGRTRVVFILGLSLLSSNWENWATVFEKAKVHPEVFAHKTIGQLADHYVASPFAASFSRVTSSSWERGGGRNGHLRAQ